MIVKTCKNRGFISLVVLVTLAVSAFFVAEGNYLLDNAKKVENSILEKVSVNEEIKNQADYLDGDKLKSATIDGNVIGTVLLPDGSFSAYKVLDADLVNTDQFSGEAKLEFLSKDIGFGEFDSQIISPFYLSDGTKTVVSILDRMVVGLNYAGIKAYPLKVLKGTVKDGKLVGLFTAQTYASGFLISGSIDENGKITSAEVLQGAERTSEAENLVAANALSLFKEIASVSSPKVLAAQTTNLGNYQVQGFTKPVFDKTKGTWVFAGGAAGTVSTSQVQNIVTYTQNIAQAALQQGQGAAGSQQITNIPASLYPYLPAITNTYITGLKEVKSATSNLTVSTVDGVSTLSINFPASTTTTTTIATGLGISNFSSANISQWANDVGYLTSSSSASILPSQTGNNGKVLGTTGTSLAWITNSSGVAWGAITGALTDQSDLVTALSAKANTSSLGTLSSQNANNVSITGGSLSGLTSVGATTFTGAFSGNATSATTATTGNALANTDSAGQSAITAINSATTGTINTARLDSSVTTQGNTFNGISQLVKLDTSGNLPALNGSNLTEITGDQVLPSQTGNNGKVLGTNGSTVSWVTNSASVAWGGITGTLSNQTDLNTALSGKLGTSLTSANIFVGNGTNTATGVAVTGDVTIDNSGATTIGANKVTLGQMATLTANSIIGNNTGSAATPIALSTSQVKSLLAIATGDVSGLGTIATQNSNNVSITGGSLSGLTGITFTSGNFDQSAATSGTFKTGGGAVSLNGDTTIAAGKSLTFTSGAGTSTQNYLSNSGTESTLNHTNNGSSGTNISKVLSLAITGTDNTGGTNTITGIDVPNITAHTNNTYYGLVFGTGLNDILRYNSTQLISGTGILQSAALSGTYSNNLTLNGSTNSISASTLTATGGTINSTSVGATTASTGKFTTLTSTGVTDLGNAGASNVTIATTGTGNTTIGNATGTFALISNGGLNVTTGGALTGVASIDTITASATALGFAGTGSVTTGAATALSIAPGTTGALNLATTNTGNVAIGNSTGTFALTSSGGLNVTTGGALTGVASVDTITHSATALGFAGTGSVTTGAATALSITPGTTGALNLATTNTGNVAIGNATGTLAVTSSGGLNVTTGGVLSGVVSLDTITTDSTHLTFAGAGTLASTGSNALNLNGTPVNINTGTTTNTAIGNATGTFALTSNGGLNVTTAGALTGVASIDTITHDATHITFAGAGTVASTGSNALTLTGGAASTWSIGSGNALTLTSSTIQVSSAGVLSLAGAQSIDITSITAGNALTVQPSVLGTSSGTGGALNLKGGNESGTTSTGGAVNINAGTGTSTNGGINIGITTASAISLGNASGTFALTSSGGLNVTTGGALTGVASVDTITHSATAIGFAGTGSVTTGAASALSINPGTTGALNLATTNTGNVAIGNSTGTFALTSSGGLNVTTGGALTGVASVDTITHSATALGFAGTGSVTTGAATALSITPGTTGALNLATANTGNVTIGNATGTFALTSSGGLNVTTGGALTGVASIDTITHDATHITFAGAGSVASTGSNALNLTGGAASTWSLGANALTLISSNFNVSSAGVVTLAGAQTADITTTAGTAPTALVFQPGNNTTSSGTGAAFSLKAGNESGTTSTGGSLTLDAGSGTSAGGAVTIGGTNAASLALGRSAATFALTSLGGLNVTTGGALTGVASIDTITTSATNLTFAGAGTVASTGANTLNLNGTPVNINTGTTTNTAIGNATGTFALTSNGGLNVTTGGALTGVASLDTITHSATALGFAGTGSVITGAATTLSITPGTTGALNLATTNTGNVAIGNSTGTFALTSNGGLNVSTAGALSGISGITMASGNFDQSGAASGTFKTGGGAVTLNGDTTVASGKKFVITGASGDPATTNGILWYDTTANKYKIVENGGVKVLCNMTDLGCGTGGGGGIATVKEGGTSIVTSATVANFAAADFIITDETGGQAGIAIDYPNSKIIRKSDSTVTFDAGVTLVTTGNTNGLTLNTGTGVSGNSGAINIQTGGTTTSGTSGAIAIDVGAGASANGAITIGTTNASGLSLGRSAATFALASSGGLNVTTGGALTGVASIDTITTSATALGFAGTGSLTSGATTTLSITPGTTGALNLATTNTGNVAIGNSTGTFALTSNGGLNVTTGGALTGVASLNTITTSATNLTFAGAGTVASTGSNALTLTGGAASTWSIGSGNALTLTSSSIQVSSAGVLSLAGAQSADITSITAGNALTVQPAVLGTSSGTGGALNLKAGNESGTTSTGGAVNINAGTGTSNNGGINLGVTTGKTIALGNGTDNTTLTLNGTGATTLGGTLAVNGVTLSLGNGSAATINTPSGSAGISITPNGTGTLNLGAGNTGNVAIGNATGTFALTSSGGLNVTTGGALTGVASIDTITTSATALGFAGTGSVTTGAATVLSITPGTTGALNLATTNTGNVAIGNSTGTFALTSSGGLNVTTGGALTGVASVDTITHSATALGFAGTGSITTANTNALSLTPGTTGALNLATTNTGNVVVGNATGTFALTSNGGLNVTTAGALTGVSSIDTIIHDATHITFAGAGTVASTGSNTLNLTGGAASTWSLGSNALTLTTSNFNISSAGVVTLAGGQSADITTTAGTSPTALIFQPGNNTTAGSTGAGLTLQAGNDSGATAATGGLLTLKGGNATGGSQTGGGVTIDSGSGTTGGAITIGGTNAASLALGRSSATFALTSSGGLNVTMAGALTGVASIDTVTSSATALGFAGTGSITTGAATTLSITPGTTGALNLATTNTGNVAIGNATGTFALTSNGGLNVTTAGALTGVASIDTITHSATAITFAGAGAVASTGSNALTLTGGAASTWSIGASNALTLTSSTIQVSSAGVLSIPGAQSTDITSITAGNALTVQPLVLSAASGAGGALNLKGGNESGTTSTGGAVAINAGTGTSNNGGINIGATTAKTISLGNGTDNTTLTLTGTGLTTLGGALTVNGVTLSLGNGSAATINTPSGGAAITIAPNGTGVLSLGTANTGNVAIGNSTGTLALTSNTLNLSTAGAFTGVTGLTFASGNFDQSASSGTFKTGTGAVSLNGTTTLAASKALIITGGAGDPTATTGTFWYDTTANKFKIVENTVVKTLCNLTDAGCGTGGTADLDTVYTNDADKIMTVNNSSGLIFNNTSTGDIAVKKSGTAVFTITNFSATLVNGLTFTPSATGVAETLAATGTDTDIALAINSKANGALTLDSGTTGNVNLGTGATAKTITIGNLTGATAITLNAGTGAISHKSMATNGNIMTIGAGSAVTVAGSGTALVGLNIDLASNYTAADDSITGTKITLPATSDTDATVDNLIGLQISGSTVTVNSGTTANPIWRGLEVTVPDATTTAGTSFTGDGIRIITTADTQSTALTTNINAFDISSAGAITQNTAAGTYNWNGLTMTTPNITQTTGTVNSKGVSVALGTITTGGTQTGYNLTTPTLTDSASATWNVYGNNISSAGALTANTNAASVINWFGNNIVMPTLATTLGSITADGYRVLIPASAAMVQTSGTATMNGLEIVSPTTSGPASGSLNGIKIGTLTSAGAGTETGINIGQGWDTAIQVKAPAAFTQSSVLTGLTLDFNTTFTPLAGSNITASDVKTSALTISSGATTTTYTGYGISTAGTLITQTAGTPIINWNGASFTMPVITGNITGSAITSNGVSITTGNITQVSGATVTETGVNISMSGTTLTTGGILTGVTVTPPTTLPSVGTTRSLFLGTSTSSTANTYDVARADVGNIASTATNNYSTLELRNGGTGFFDLELIRGMIDAPQTNTFYDDFIGKTIDTTNKWTFAVLGSGTCSSTIFATGLNGYLRASTGTTAGNGCNLSTQGTLSNGFFQRGNNPVFESKVKVTSTTMTGVRSMNGFANALMATGVETQTTNHAWIGKVAADTAWQCVSADGTTESKVTTGVTIVSGTYYRLRVQVLSGTTPQVICTVDDGTTVTRISKTTNVPAAATAMDIYEKCETSDTTGDTCDYDYVRAWQDDPPLTVDNSQPVTNDAASVASVIQPLENSLTLNINQEGKVVIKGEDGQDVISFDSKGNATFAGTVTAQKIKAGQIEGLEDYVLSVSTESATPVATPESSLATNIFKSITEFWQKVTFYADVTFLGRPTFNNDTAGFAVISRGASEVEVTFDREYESTPVVILTPDHPVLYSLSDVSTKGFKIKLSGSSPEDIKFNWHAVLVKDVKTVFSQLVSTPMSTLMPIPTQTPTPVASPTETPTGSPEAIIAPTETPAPSASASASPI